MTLDIQRLNLRDLGGLPTADGRRVRPGRLLRSGALWPMTEAERAALPPLRAVYDMRSENERQFHPDPPFPGAVYRHIAVMESGRRELAQSKRTLEDKVDDILNGYARGEAIASVRMREVYRRMVHSGEMCRCIEELLLQLAGNSDGAVLFHCAAGKDRTGFVAAVLLRLLGVPDGPLYRDYLYTNTALRGEIDEAERIALARTAGRAAADYVRGFFLACPCWLASALSEIDRQFHSVEEYVLAQTRVTQNDLASFRTSCLL